MMLSTFAKRTAKNSTSSTNNSFIKNRLYFTKTKPTLFAHHAERGVAALALGPKQHNVIMGMRI